MGNLNFNNLFIGLSIEQIVVLGILVIVSVLFGLMAGASIFYPLGYRRCRKDGKGATAAPTVSQEALAAAVLAQQGKEVPDTFDEEENFDYDSDDLFNFVDEEDAAETESIAAQPAAQPAEEPLEEAPKAEPIVDDAPIVPALLDVAPGTGEQVVVAGEPLRDEVFVRMEARNKRQVPLVGRGVVLDYCARMTPLAGALPIIVQPQSAPHAYDRLLVKDYTFAVVYEYNKVLRLVLRLHANTIAALRQSAGNTVQQQSDWGEDWYGWVVTDIEHCEKVVAKVLDMSYKYVAHATYKRGKEGDFLPKVEPYEEAVSALADAYEPAADAVYVALAGQMNDKYQLHYFGKREAAQFAATIAGSLPVSVEDSGNMAVLKAGSYMFAAVYESYGAVKVLFRADKEYVDVLRAEHPYVGASEVPKSEYRQWYYAVLDKSFDEEQITQILTTAYQHVVAQMA